MVDADILKKTKSMLYTHLAYVYERQKVVLDTGISDFEWEIKYSDIPCKLSVNEVFSAQQGEVYALIKQEVKLFLDADIEVLPGSIVEVLKDGVIYAYKSSGIARKYSTHQEIMLLNKTDGA